MDLRRITATDAARRFSDVLGTVRYQGVSFEITRGREVVAHLVPARPAATTVAELDALFARLPRLDPADAAAFAADLDVIRGEAGAPPDPWAS